MRKFRGAGIWYRRSPQRHTHNGRPCACAPNARASSCVAIYEIDAFHLFPKWSCREVNGIEDPEFGGHWLRGAVKDSRFDVHHVERGYDRKDEGAQTFGPD